MSEAHEESKAVTDAKRAWQELRDDAAADTRPDRDPRVVVRRLIITGAALVCVVVLAGIIGAVVPLGIGGAMIVLLTLAVVLALGVTWALNRPEAIEPKDMVEVVISELADGAISWIGTRSVGLPADARVVMGRISERLRTLDPMIERLDSNGPEAAEVRGLFAVQMPALVDEFQRVPEPLRTVVRNGQTPEQTLVKGLGVIESETAELVERLAQTDLDGLQTRGRYLDMKYGDQA